MEGSSRSEVCPQLLDLIPKQGEWIANRDGERRHGLSEEKKLELRLAPPGEDWSVKDNTKTNHRDRDESLFSLAYFSPMASMNHNTSINNNSNGSTVFSSPWSSSAYQGQTQHNHQQTKAPSFLQFPSTPQSLPVMAQEASQPCCTKVVDLQSSEKKTFSPSSVPNSSQKRYSSFSLVFIFLIFWTEDIHLLVTFDLGGPCIIAPILCFSNV